VSVTLGVSGSATSDPFLRWEYIGSGGPAIELRVRFGGAWQAARWQELWTVVEWQDAFGDWHEVEGWRGALDEVARGEGRKVWWVSLDDLGKGPFRWTVCRRPAGRPLAHSKPFICRALGRREWWSAWRSDREQDHCAQWSCCNYSVSPHPQRLRRCRRRRPEGEGVRKPE
jgi:hypothetical protein